MTSREETSAMLALIFCHFRSLVSVNSPLTDTQIEELVCDLLDGKGYLRMEEVKYVIKRALRREKIFSRLDYNVVMNWFENYETERNEIAIRMSEHTDARNLLGPESDEPLISFDEYVAQLKQSAADNPEAADKLKEIERQRKAASAVNLKGNDAQFKTFYIDYLKHKKQSEKKKTDNKVGQ